MSKEWFDRHRGLSGRRRRGMYFNPREPGWYAAINHWWFVVLHDTRFVLDRPAPYHTTLICWRHWIPLRHRVAFPDGGDPRGLVVCHGEPLNYWKFDYGTKRRGW